MDLILNLLKKSDTKPEIKPAIRPSLKSAYDIKLDEENSSKIKSDFEKHKKNLAYPESNVFKAFVPEEKKTGISSTKIISPLSTLHQMLYLAL